MTVVGLPPLRIPPSPQHRASTRYLETELILGSVVCLIYLFANLSNLLL